MNKGKSVSNNKVSYLLSRLLCVMYKLLYLFLYHKISLQRSICLIVGIADMNICYQIYTIYVFRLCLRNEILRTGCPSNILTCVDMDVPAGRGHLLKRQTLQTVERKRYRVHMYVFVNVASEIGDFLSWKILTVWVIR